MKHKAMLEKRETNCCSFFKGEACLPNPSGQTLFSPSSNPGQRKTKGLLRLGSSVYILPCFCWMNLKRMNRMNHVYLDHVRFLYLISQEIRHDKIWNNTGCTQNLFINIVESAWNFVMNLGNSGNFRKLCPSYSCPMHLKFIGKKVSWV